MNAASEQQNDTSRETEPKVLDLDKILDWIHGYAILSLDRNGVVSSWNAGAESTKGYARDEILGRNFEIFYTEVDRQAGLPQRALELARKHGRHEFEGWRVKKSGELFWANVLIEAVMTPTGEVEGYVKVTRDISDKLALKRLEDELHQSQKLEMVGQLTGGIAHDFNNLLTVIEGGYDLVKTYSADARIDRLVEVNKVAISRSKKLIAQLLAFSGKQVLHTTVSHVNGLITVFEELIRAAVGARIKVNFRLQQSLPAIRVDQAQLQSSLLNLVVNARDAMPQGGSIEVFTEILDLPERNFPAPYDTKAGRFIVVGVHDTGSGMSEPVRLRAIEPFFTTKPVGKGTGLGLSQAFGFARQSNGTLTIESREGGGTTVRIMLPVTEGALEEETDRSKKTILLVDDDTGVRMLAAEMLRTLGYVVYEAEDGRNALDQLHRHADIGCVFTDIIMSGMTGVELIAEVRKYRPNLPAVLSSGYSKDHLKDAATLPENTSFIQKPYTLRVLDTVFGPMPMPGLV